MEINIIMISKSISRFVIVLFFYSTYSHAAMTLFDPNRGSQPAPPAVVKPKPKPVNIKAPAIDYKLIGISSFSSKFYLSFQNTKDRKIKRIKWQKDKPESEPLLSGFHIKEVESRRVILELDNGEAYACKENELSRISCKDDKKEIVFDLVTNKPIRSPKNVLGKIAAQKGKPDLANKTAIKNPFKLH